jgi:hypothetical protein
MTELKWLNLSGLMRQCIYNCECADCPFKEFRQMDFIQQFQSLNKISETKGDQLLADCRRFRLQNYIHELSHEQTLCEAVLF